jgi:hypothetical protein
VKNKQINNKEETLMADHDLPSVAAGPVVDDLDLESGTVPVGSPESAKYVPLSSWTNFKLQVAQNLVAFSLLEEFLFMIFNAENVFQSLQFIDETVDLGVSTDTLQAIAYSMAILGMFGDMLAVCPVAESKGLFGINNEGRIKETDQPAATDSFSDYVVKLAKTSREYLASVSLTKSPVLLFKLFFGYVFPAIGMMFGGAAQAVGLSDESDMAREMHLVLESTEAKVLVCLLTTFTGFAYYAAWSWDDTSKTILAMMQRPQDLPAARLAKMSTSTAVHANVDFSVMEFYRTLTWAFLGAAFAKFAGLGEDKAFFQALSGIGGAVFSISRFNSANKKHIDPLLERDAGEGYACVPKSDESKDDLKRFNPNKISRQDRMNAWSAMPWYGKVGNSVKPLLYGTIRAAGLGWFAYRGMQGVEGDSAANRVQKGAAAMSAMLGAVVFAWTCYEEFGYMLNATVASKDKFHPLSTLTDDDAAWLKDHLNIEGNAKALGKTLSKEIKESDDLAGIEFSQAEINKLDQLLDGASRDDIKGRLTRTQKESTWSDYGKIALMYLFNIPDQFCRAIAFPLFLNEAFPDMDPLYTIMLGLWMGWAYALINFDYFKPAILGGMDNIKETLGAEAELVNNLLLRIPEGLYHLGKRAMGSSTCCTPSVDHFDGDVSERTGLFDRTSANPVYDGSGDGVENGSKKESSMGSWCSFLPSLSCCFRDSTSMESTSTESMFSGAL